MYSPNALTHHPYCRSGHVLYDCWCLDLAKLARAVRFHFRYNMYARIFQTTRADYSTDAECSQRSRAFSLSRATSSETADDIFMRLSSKSKLAHVAACAGATVHGSRRAYYDGHRYNNRQLQTTSDVVTSIQHFPTSTNAFLIGNQIMTPSLRKRWCTKSLNKNPSVMRAQSSLQLNELYYPRCRISEKNTFV